MFHSTHWFLPGSATLVSVSMSLHEFIVSFNNVNNYLYELLEPWRQFSIFTSSSTVISTLSSGSYVSIEYLCYEKVLHPSLLKARKAVPKSLKLSSGVDKPAA